MLTFHTCDQFRILWINDRQHLLLMSSYRRDRGRRRGCSQLAERLSTGAISNFFWALINIVINERWNIFASFVCLRKIRLITLGGSPVGEVQVEASYWYLAQTRIIIITNPVLHDRTLSMWFWPTRCPLASYACVFASLARALKLYRSIKPWYCLPSYAATATAAAVVVSVVVSVAADLRCKQQEQYSCGRHIAGRNMRLDSQVHCYNGLTCQQTVSAMSRQQRAYCWIYEVRKRQVAPSDEGN